MNFSLPETFASDTNDLVTLLRNYEASINEPEKDALLRKALVTSCRLLGSIHLAALSSRMDEIDKEVQHYEKTAIKSMKWSEAMFGSANHFDYFLSNVEDGILRGAGIEEENRRLILKELAALRELAHTEVDKLTTKTIIDAIWRLREDVCHLKDQTIAAAQRRNVRSKITKTILVSVIVADAAGSILFPTASPAALAASITLGGIAQFIPAPV